MTTWETPEKVQKSWGNTWKNDQKSWGKSEKLSYSAAPPTFGRQIIRLQLKIIEKYIIGES